MEEEITYANDYAYWLKWVFDAKKKTNHFLIYKL
jgi:hypothetical protein